jgi:hypothetical protein
MIDEVFLGKLFVVSLSNALKEHSGVNEGMMDSGLWKSPPTCQGENQRRGRFVKEIRIQALQGQVEFC